MKKKKKSGNDTKMAEVAARFKAVAFRVSFLTREMRQIKEFKDKCFTVVLETLITSRQSENLNCSCLDFQMRHFQDTLAMFAPKKSLFKMLLMHKWLCVFELDFVI